MHVDSGGFNWHGKKALYCQNIGNIKLQGKARQVYLYSTFYIQWQFKVLYIKGSEIVIQIILITMN